MKVAHRLFTILLLLLANNAFHVVGDDEETITASEASASEEGGRTEAAAVAEEKETKVVIVASIEVELPSATTTTTTTAAGEEDQNEQCQEWANQGECHNNPGYMLENCAASCADDANKNAAIQKGTAYVNDGEDAAIGAFRFAEEYYQHLMMSMMRGNDSSSSWELSETVLNVAKQLQEALPPHYKAPDDLTQCSNKNKRRPCSAGKLWKRAEEMRKADMHDVAGADLIRALLKKETGRLEVDFIEKCQRTLQWAFGSIKRQREREAREAIEEAKVEKRRQEERLAMEEALERKKEYEADFVKFGLKLQESVVAHNDDDDAGASASASATVDADGTIQEDDAQVQELTKNVKQTFVQVGPQGGNWNETLQLIRKIPMSDKTVDVLLIEARCHEMLGNHKSALSAAGRLVQKAANHEPWINDSPRMMAATLGANAAMQLGLSENALSFYQTVLKFDPEQPRARKQYRGLKKVVKLMDKAEEQIQKGYNKVASGHVDDCLSAMRGLDVDSPLFRSKIQLKQCTILSGMGKHEEALENCDAAVELRISNDSVSPASRKEAHLVRGEALLLDMDYDEAVQDFRAAFDLVPEDDDTGEKRELHFKLQSTMREQQLWNGGQKDNRYNEHTGYPDGRPPQRDHEKILQLPIDLNEREKDVKCAWLRKQFKLLVKKYHPDKYKGNKKRGARKFKEVKEAKEIISSAWGC